MYYSAEKRQLRIKSNYGCKRQLLWQDIWQINFRITVLSNTVSLQVNELLCTSQRVLCTLLAGQTPLFQCYKIFYRPAVVAWFAKASVFQSVNSAPSANGGSNPIEVWCINRSETEMSCCKFQNCRAPHLSGGLWCMTRC